MLRPAVVQLWRNGVDFVQDRFVAAGKFLRQGSGERGPRLAHALSAGHCVRQYQPPRFMSCAEAADQLLKIVHRRRESGESSCRLSDRSIVVGLARVGHETQVIKGVDLGPPLHSLIIPAPEMHPLEIEYLQQFCDEDLQALVKRALAPLSTIFKLDTTLSSNS